jgi:hypothetical protein
MTGFAPGSDIVLRFHDLNRLVELDRAAFSVVGQTVRPVTAHVVVQRFGDEGVKAVRARLAPMFRDLDGAFLEVHDWRAPHPADGRSCLLNEGVRHAKRRYLSFLDYDDVLFPEAHALLRQRLETSGAAIAFGGVEMMDVTPYDDFVMPRGKRVSALGGWTLMDLFERNRAPVHSYVIDRERVATRDIHFDENLTWEEDYEFLLRACATYRVDLEAISTAIGYYNFKTDGSNSVPTTQAAHAARAEVYERVRREMFERKRKILVTGEVLRDLKLQGRGRKPTVVADLLAQLDA